MEKKHEDGKKPVVTPPEAVVKVAEQVQQTVGKTAGQVGQTAAQISTEAARSATEARRAMRESAYAVKESAANALLSAAENIRREAVNSGSEDVIRQAHQLSRGMEKAAVYLDSRTLDQIGEDATEVIKENPWQTLGITFLIGLIIGLIMRSGRRD